MHRYPLWGDAVIVGAQGRRLEIESGGVWVRVPNQNCLPVCLLRVLRRRVATPHRRQATPHRQEEPTANRESSGLSRGIPLGAPPSHASLGQAARHSRKQIADSQIAHDAAVVRRECALTLLSIDERLPVLVA